MKGAVNRTVRKLSRGKLDLYTQLRDEALNKSPWKCFQAFMKGRKRWYFGKGGSTVFHGLPEGKFAQSLNGGKGEY